jgi:hypothetical protein
MEGINLISANGKIGLRGGSAEESKKHLPDTSESISDSRMSCGTSSPRTKESERTGWND